MVALLAALPSATWTRADVPELSYEKDIRPIFRAHCYDCHGATEELEGGLDLRLVRSMQSGGDSGPAIVPGDAEASLLMERVRSGEMPPGDTKVSEQELATLQRWVAAGCPTARPEPESLPPGLGITPEERAFWSFQPIQAPSADQLLAMVPDDVARHPIDKLYLADTLGISNDQDAAAHRDRLAETSSRLIAPEASKRTLIVRAYFDLTGLPPSPEELANWLQHPSDDWYDQLLTSLLDSPHYGERWGRHWLDAAGYADSEGYTTADAPRSWAWKYRDWVVRALNEDKPFDRFITEQLAGDELAGPIEGDLTDQQISLLTATGFLRMAADGTGSGADTPEARNQVMADTLKIVGTSLLGMTLQCAQCHDHRYDPLPQTDYFALRAVFEPALDWQAWKPPAARQISLYTAADREKAAEVEAEAQQVATEKQTRLDQYMGEALDQELAKFEPPLRDQLRTAYQTPAAQRDDAQKQLLMQHPSINITPGNLYQYIPDSKPKLEEYDKRIAEIRAKKPPEAFIRALVEPAAHVPETKLFHRGDHQQPKQTILPAAPQVACPEDQTVAFPADDPDLPTTGRRSALARWLTSDDNPLFSRVMVNRIWLHHFGTGIVKTPGDFGRLGATPSHPQLLDWLAVEFRTQGWSLKKLHRTIMTSQLYKQQRGNPSNEDADVLQATAEAEAEPSSESLPATGNRFANLIRLDAEVIRDAMLAVTNQLDPTIGGPPLTIKEDETGQVVVDGPQRRRSLYIQSRRTQPVAMLQSFDAPQMETNCEIRTNSTVATQSLMLLNGQFILTQAAQLADRVASEPASVDAERLASLPVIPTPAGSSWQYGFGSVDVDRGRTASFQLLPHWTGTQWQGGESLPDPQIGWALLHAQGGHPDAPQRSVIRRWVATSGGKLSVQGTLAHGSENGDGVQGRLVSSRHGLLGTWTAHHGQTDTAVAPFEIEPGDTIDFVTESRQNHTSDSFNWPVTLAITIDGQPSRTIASADQFGGPPESVDTVPGQITRAWQLVYGRPPSDDELKLACQFVSQQITTLETIPEATPKGRGILRQSMTNLCQALLSSNEFLYVE